MVLRQVLSTSPSAAPQKGQGFKLSFRSAIFHLRLKSRQPVIQSNTSRLWVERFSPLKKFIGLTEHHKLSSLMKEVCHGWYSQLLYCKSAYLFVSWLVGQRKILFGSQGKLAKKLPLFEKIFIHPPSAKWRMLGRFPFDSGKANSSPNSRTCHGQNQSFLRFQCSGISFLKPETLRFPAWVRYFKV